MENMILRLAMNGFLSFLFFFNCETQCTSVLCQWLEDLPLANADKISL
jgi:hypothetical protein